MPLKFKGNAIVLSGETGTKPKSEILGSYYPFWWGIASGGKTHGYPKNTSIVDLNAATGKVFIEETGEEILGSAGHALKLKMETPGTDRLKLVLVEEKPNCFSLLKNVIKEQWPGISLDQATGPIANNRVHVYLLNTGLDNALNIIGMIDDQAQLGLAIFLFDPLRSVSWETVQKVALRRIPTFYKIGTEFIIFLFTSDFFLGRDEFASLPNSSDSGKWSMKERASVENTDLIFPDRSWRNHLLTTDSIADKEEHMVTLYKDALHGWFRYVLPLPFRPKKEQIYHLFFCSNFETGIRATRSFYTKRTLNPRIPLSNAEVYEKFQKIHPDKKAEHTGSKPLEFRILWKIIKEHEEGYCDVYCQDLIREQPNFDSRHRALDWLLAKGYLRPVHYDDLWGAHPPTYLLNWQTVQQRLGVSPPPPLKPLPPSSEQPKLC